MHYLILVLLAFLSPLASDEPSAFENEEPREIIIFNRILAKVGDKTISVMDVMKKMDLFMQKYYSHLTNSKLARFQFYSSQWKDYLSQMIDQELMIADAEKLEVKVTDAEVREEVMNRFGPNVMPALDKLGITYEEARKMIYEDMLVQRMVWYRVNSKALGKVSSSDVKEAYQRYCEQNPERNEWEYQVLSIRGPERQSAEKFASRAYELLQSKIGLEAACAELQNGDSSISITLSPETKGDEKSLAESHKEILKTLSVDSFSPPVAQKSRVDNATVYRIFYLKNHIKKTLLPFDRIADQLKDDLLQEAAVKENTQYIAKLRKRLSYDANQTAESLPDNFEPFAIR